MEIDEAATKRGGAGVGGVGRQVEVTVGRCLRDAKSGCPLSASQESGLRMVEDQDVLRASRVTFTWKTHSYSPHSATPSTLVSSARLGSVSVQLARTHAALSLALLARAMRGAPRAGADSLDIYMHTRYHSGEQSTRGTRTKRVSSCSPSLLLRPRERKEEERRNIA